MNKHTASRQVAYILIAGGALAKSLITEYSFKIAEEARLLRPPRGKKAQWKAERNGRR